MAIMELVLVFEIISVLLLLFLLSVYISNYRQMKIVLGMELIIFSAFLLLQNLLGLYFHIAKIDYYSSEVMDHAMVLSAIQTLALAVLAWVTWKE